MRKKSIVWAYLLILSLGTILSLYIPKNEVTAKEAVVIPGQAIRLRILANSDLGSDQALKRHVRDAVNAKISVWVKDLTSIKEAQKVIRAKLPEIQRTAEETVKKQGSKQAVKAEFGKVSFPTKLYGDYLYPAGEYQAILITLGAGKGANWWCVLFPPLCFLDFSNGVAVSDGFEDSKQKPAKTDKQEPASAVEKADKAPDENQSPGTDQGSGKAGNSDNDHVSDKKQVTDKDKASRQQKRDLQPKQGKGREVSQNRHAKQTASQAEGPHQDHSPAKDEKQTAEDTTKSVENQTKTEAPVYTAEDEQPVQVKFFVVELWHKLFN